MGNIESTDAAVLTDTEPLKLVFKSPRRLIRSKKSSFLSLIDESHLSRLKKFGIINKQLRHIKINGIKPSTMQKLALPNSITYLHYCISSDLTEHELNALAHILLEFPHLKSFTLDMTKDSIYVSAKMRKLIHAFHSLENLEELSLLFFKPLFDGEEQALMRNLVPLSKAVNMMSNLQNFHIYLKSSLHSEEINKISKVFPLFTKVSKLELVRHTVDYIPDHRLSPLSQMLEDLENLTQLRVALPLLENSDTLTNALFNSIKNLPKLKELTLETRCEETITERGLKTLDDACTHLYLLEKLVINIESSIISPQVETVILSCIAKLPSLKYLDLTGLISSDGAIVFMCHSFRGLHKLKDLKFNIMPSQDLTNLGLEHLAGHLAGWSRLESFGITCQEFPRSYKDGIDVLCSSISDLSGVNNLMIKITLSSEMPGVYIRPLGTALARHQNLKGLDISFCQLTRIADRDLSPCFDALKLMKGLESLELDLTGCEGISEEAFLSLTDALANLTKLNTFHFYLTADQIVNNFALRKFSHALGKLENLTDLKLAFGIAVSNPLDDDIIPWQNITKEGICDLSDALCKLRRLRSLDLLLESFLSLRDDTITYFSSCLMKLINLKKIELNFSKCLNIEEKGKKVLKDALMTFTELEHLVLLINDSYIYQPSMMNSPLMF